MTDLPSFIDELRALADMACNDALAAQDIVRLEELLRGNAKAQQLYLRRVFVDRWLRWEFAHRAHEPRSCPIPALAPASTIHHSMVCYLSSGWPLAYLVATVIVGAGLIIGAITHVSQSGQIVHDSAPAAVGTKTGIEPNTEFIGRITGMVDCKWSGPAVDSPYVLLGHRYELASGLLEITYDTGARVILQGPVTYQAESKNGGFLPVGKLTGKVDAKKARGFVVRTPTALVTDLGTEFGVEVDKQGATVSHVFRGLVGVQFLSANGTPGGKLRILRKDETVRVEGSDNDRRIIDIRDFAASRFVRDISKHSGLTVKTFDLVDAVAGGDGFSGRRNRGIDPTTGRTVDALREVEVLLGDGRYHRAEGLPFVDGVFIPDGRRGPIQTDSAGHTFDEFGSAMNETWHCIWAGGVIPVNDPRRTMSAVLGGVDYSSSDHGLLYMHANKGITFDLDAIRRANPGSRPVRFRASVGSTEAPASSPFRGNARGKTLFVDDFEATKAGALSVVDDLNPAVRKGGGSWSLANPAGMLEQVEIVRETKSTGVGSNRYLRVRRAWAQVSGWHVGDTVGRVVQAHASIRVSSESGSTAFLDGFGGEGIFDGRCFTVYLGADGAVKYYDGRDSVRTDLVCHPDKWQEVTVTADLAAHTFSIKLDDQPLFTGGLWRNGTTRVTHLVLGNNSALGTVCYDNIAFGVLGRSAFENSRPEPARSDAWILVDGERRSGRRGLNRAGGVYSITVPISENDRFLTLAVTDGGDGAFWDSVIFGDPRLEMGPVGEQRDPNTKSKERP
jgi:hypothetical protein